MTIEGFLDALDDYQRAKRRYDKAAKGYGGVSPGYALRDEHEDWEKAKGRLGAVLDRYVTERVTGTLVEHGLIEAPTTDEE